MAKNRAYLDEVMIRLELDNGGYESLLSESECEEETTESFSYQLELDRMEALNASIVLGIDIPGLEEQEEEAEQSVIFVYKSHLGFYIISVQEPMLEEINANEIVKGPILDKITIRKAVNGGWNHVDNGN